LVRASFQALNISMMFY